jgi:hypothetical protein
MRRTYWIAGFMFFVLSLIADQVSGTAFSAFALNGGWPSQQEAVVVRPCNITPVQKPRKEKDQSKRKDSHDPTVSSTDACLEAQATAIDIQEFFQNYVREQKWKIADEHAAENAWTFYRYLEKDELLDAAKGDSSTTRVVWTGGKAFFQIRTTDLDGGFARVSISATFRGYGENSDQFAPPREFWRMNSNGKLEAQLLSALETHFKTLH